MKRAINEYRLTNKESGQIPSSSFLLRPSMGFTLIELMVAVVIVGVLFGTIVTATNGINRRSRDNRRHTDVQKLQSALQEYYADNHFYPTTAEMNAPGGFLRTGNALTGPSGRTYLGQTPLDPGGSLPYCYSAQVAQTVAAGCANIVNSTTKCEYYELCVSLEDPQPGPTCSCGGSNYNLMSHSP